MHFRGTGVWGGLHCVYTPDRCVVEREDVGAGKGEECLCSLVERGVDRVVTAVLRGRT